MGLVHVKVEPSGPTYFYSFDWIEVSWVRLIWWWVFGRLLGQRLKGEVVHKEVDDGPDS